jgi:DNA mismatch endonuclease (patch repair protein)
MHEGRPVTTRETSARMSVQARRDTRPELALRKALHALGCRYRVDWPLPGMARRRADIAFTRKRVVIFVDGCFWHSCPIHRTAPANNASWWADKLATNVRRDRETDEHLRAAGWTVMRFWEHEALVDVVDRVLQILGDSDDSTRRARLRAIDHR